MTPPEDIEYWQLLDLLMAEYHQPLEYFENMPFYVIQRLLHCMGERQKALFGGSDHSEEDIRQNPHRSVGVNDERSMRLFLKAHGVSDSDLNSGKKSFEISTGRGCELHRKMVTGHA